MSDVKKFETLAARIAAIMSDDNGPVARARRLPDECASAINRLRINKEYYPLDDHEKALGQRVLAEMKRLEHARGDAERRSHLLALSAELESIRAVLPQMAAQLAIEMGARARALAEEANKDAP
jgi:hypothetical protein